MANVYPPSPALSACDSLADIEDLDAFLEAQGPLSTWPTPPPASHQKPARVTTQQVQDSILPVAKDTEDDAGNVGLWRLSTAFTQVATGGTRTTFLDVERVLIILLRAEAPPETLALAYNILRVVANDDDYIRVPGLAVTACLSLATTFLDDKAPSAEWFTRNICKGAWSANVIEATILHFVFHPEARMLTLQSEEAINTALVELHDIALGVPSEVEDDDSSMSSLSDNSDIGVVMESPEMSAPLKLTMSNAVHVASESDEAKSISTLDAVLEKHAPEALKIAISNTAHWLHGAVTPADTPAETPVVETNFFLPLL